MRRALLCLAILAVGSAATAKKPVRKPYQPPVLEPEPAPEPAKETAVESRTDDTAVLARPWYPSPRIGTLAKAARMKVRGKLEARPKERLCPKATWYAIEPFGWVCSRHVRPTSAPPTTEPALVPRPGDRLPYQYGMVKKGATANQYASLEDIDGNNVQRKLEQHDTIAILSQITHHGAHYYKTVDGMLVEPDNIYKLGPASTWQGLALKPGHKFPFAWIRLDKTKVLAEPKPRAKVVERLERRTLIDTLGEDVAVGQQRFFKIGEGRWVAHSDLCIARASAPPDGVLTSPERQWIDVDLGEQVMVAYEDAVPVYATVVSTGRKVKTPRGNYPIWARVLAHTMKNQPYEDAPYHVARVPWTMFFQTHNAVHGCYWHNDYGSPRSHGCINTSPLDVKHIFEWVKPHLPPGWFGIRPVSLFESVTVHVRNSKLKPAFKQERPIGPPDKDEEQEKLEKAEQRRQEEAAKAAAQPPAPGTPAPPPGMPAPPPGTPAPPP
jgi:hypothetical protein